jgi:hypothetical protein
MADYTGKVTAYNGHPLYEGRPIGAVNDPLGTGADVVFNAGYDLIDMMQGLGTMGSAVAGRAYETLPFVPGGLQSPIRQSDFQMLPKMGMAIVDNYAHSYVDPVLQGRPQDLISHAIAHPVNTALDLTGVGSLLKLPNLLRQASLGAVSRSAALTSALESATNFKNTMLKKAGTFGEDIANQAIETGPLAEDMLNAVEKVAPITTAGKEAAKMQSAFAGEVLATDSQFIDDLGKYWQNVPSNLRGEVKAYAEGWHPNQWNGKGIPQEVADYLKRAEDYSAIMRDKISGMVDASDLILDKYQPAAIKFGGLSTEQWQALSREKQLNILQAIKEKMESRGIVPQYSPHIMPGEVREVLGHPATLTSKNVVNGATKEIRLAREIREIQQTIAKLEDDLKNALPENQLSLQEQLLQQRLKLKDLTSKKAGFLKSKQSAGEKSVDSHYDALRTRWIQIAQFQAAYKNILKAALDHGEELQILKNAPDMAAKQMAEQAVSELKALGHVEINVQELGKAILGGLEGAVLHGDELNQLLQKTLPETVFLPQEIKRALDIAMKTTGAKGRSPFIKAYDEITAISKRYMLGGNATYGLAQGGQSIFMLELVSMNGVRSAITSIASYYLAFNKKVRQMVPLSITGDVIGATVNSRHYIGNSLQWLAEKAGVNKLPGKIELKFGDKAVSIGSADAVKNMLHAYDYAVDFAIKTGTIFDSIARAKASIHHALMIAQENTPLGTAVKEMFDTTKSVSLLERTFLDDTAKMNIARQVNDALGDFKAIADKPGMKVLGRITPFPAWLNFIAGYANRLRANHPYKTMILNNVAQLQERFVADPDTPHYLEGAPRLTALGPNGLPTVAHKEAMNPLTSIGDLAGIARFILTGQGDKTPRQQLVAPLQLGLMLMVDRLNPMTSKPFRDPNLVVDAQGRQYKIEDAESVIQGRLDHIEEQKPLPDDLVLRTLFPPLSKQLETILEKAYTGGQRSQMSGLLYRAPKRDANGEIKESADWTTLMIQLLVNFQPVEYDPSASHREERAARMNSRSFLKQIRRIESNPFPGQ